MVTFSGEKSQKVWSEKADCQNSSQRSDRSGRVDTGTAHVRPHQGNYSQKNTDDVIVLLL